MFSTRLPGTLEPTRLARAADVLRTARVPFADLTESNPTRACFEYESGLLSPLGRDAGLSYRPAPLGLLEAREAVAGDYVRRGLTVQPARVVITASTSESYSFLFKLLCNPGDNVIVPEPSYPLFRYLTALDGVEARSYRLSAAEGWMLDTSTVERLIDPTTRAVLVVTPNNPTGTRIRRDVLMDLGSLCARSDVALIGDEVFIDYTLEDTPEAARSVLEQGEALTFSLGGLSKTVGLPQLKLGWIAVGGPSEVVQEALARLEVVADAYLSVGTPVQIAAGRLLEGGANVRAQILERVQSNHRTLMGAATGSRACRVPRLDGGWSAVIQAPAVAADEVRALSLLEEHRVLVHPGSLFDFEREGYFVISLLPPAAVFGPAVRRILDALDSDS